MFGKYKTHFCTKDFVEDNCITFHFSSSRMFKGHDKNTLMLFSKKYLMPYWWMVIMNKHFLPSSHASCLQYPLMVFCFIIFCTCSSTQKFLLCHKIKLLFISPVKRYLQYHPPLWKAISFISVGKKGWINTHCIILGIYKMYEPRVE